MMRLFVALTLPDMIKQQLLMIEGGIAGARWQNDAQLHLTLRFIGEVDGGTARDIVPALSNIRFHAFPLALKGVGFFGKASQPRALWVGVKDEAPLFALHKKIDHAITRLGLEPEQRRYKPHVTLARFSGRSGTLDAFLATHGDFSTPVFEVREFSLFASHLNREAAQYQRLEDFPAASS